MGSENAAEDVGYIGTNNYGGIDQLFWSVECRDGACFSNRAFVCMLLV